MQWKYILIISLFVNTGLKSSELFYSDTFSIRKEVENNIEVISIYKKDTGTLSKIISYPCSEIELTPREKNITKLCYELRSKTASYNINVSQKNPILKKQNQPVNEQIKHRRKKFYNHELSAQLRAHQKMTKKEAKALNFLEEQVRFKESASSLSIAALPRPIIVPGVSAWATPIVPQVHYVIPPSRPNIVIPISLYPIIIVTQIPNR